MGHIFFKKRNEDFIILNKKHLKAQDICYKDVNYKAKSKSAEDKTQRAQKTTTKMPNNSLRDK